MASTVFYSWQSDTPNAINRRFIKESIEGAIASIKSDSDVVDATREDDLEIDHDTKDVPGSPPIAETIFRKITECAAFVGDLTFVGTTLSGRQTPNPNVLIEYGYALAAISDARVISVMNTAVARLTDSALPFNLRHRRNPVTYSLSPAAAPAERAGVKEQLTKDLARAIKAVLKEYRAESRESLTFERRSAAPDGPSSFLGAGEVLGSIPQWSPTGASSTLALTTPVRPRLYVRVSPRTPVPALPSELAARDLIVNERLCPLSRLAVGSSSSVVRNRYGAFTAEYSLKGEIFCLTQLFLSKEIWGINAHTLNKSYLVGGDKYDFPYFPVGAIEETLKNSLDCYLSFSRNALSISGPLLVTVGVDGVENFRATTKSRFDRFSDPCVRDHVSVESEVQGGPDEAARLTEEFLAELLVACGIRS